MNRVAESQAELARQLKNARRDARLTQDELADLASISNRPIYIFEGGKGSIRLDTYLKLLDVLGLDVNVVPRVPRTEQS